MDTYSTFDAGNPSGVADLLRLGLEHAGRQQADRAAAETLKACLACRVPGDPQAGTIGRALTDCRTAPQVLQAIKQLGKSLANSTTPGQRAAGQAVYNAAIASAMLFHNLQITRRQPASLARAFTALADEPWMPPELSRHLLAAAERCR